MIKTLVTVMIASHWRFRQVALWIGEEIFLGPTGFGIKALGTQQVHQPQEIKTLELHVA